MTRVMQTIPIGELEKPTQKRVIDFKIPLFGRFDRAG